MPDSPQDQPKTHAYYRNYKDALTIITREIVGTTASHTISVYSALNWIANDMGDQFHHFSVPIGLIAYRAGLSPRKISYILKILKALNIVEVVSGQGRRVYNTYTMILQPPESRERIVSGIKPLPIPIDNDEFKKEIWNMDIEAEAEDAFWELQVKNNWRRKNPITDEMEPVWDWKTSLINFAEKFDRDKRPD